MEYIYAAMLLHRAGKPIDEENLTRVLHAAGVNVDPIKVKALVAALSEINIDEAIKSAPTFMPMMAPPAAAPAAQPAAAMEEKAKKEEERKKEEEEKKEEEALEGLAALFG
ncbi:MAG: 50S ribosomal protein P1 [Candidatus Bathyarchaeia archaeon]|nr:50S ribosomal protein P1 [Candidatus Bathyarchaeota archaeon]